ncbi:MAG TPA: peptidase M61 [Caulobacteraceae bacterium]|jgi:predicted metalloprotease with PDZ domain
MIWRNLAWSVAWSVACSLALVAGSASALTGPQPAPPTPPIEAPRDVPYPGQLKLLVDATDLARGIFDVRERVPVSGPGSFTLLFPEWLPGNHGPSGPLDKLAGLEISANGVPIAWTRDPVNVFAFHVEIPPGVSAIELSFQFLSAVSKPEGRIMMTPDMLSLQWDTVALYPAGYFSRDIEVEPSVRLPAGFTGATALETRSVAGDVTTYKPASFNTLIDSPMIAGRYFRRFDLDPGGPARVSLDVIADRPDELDATPAQIDAHKALVTQAYRLFGSHHYDHYDFLVSLSNKMGGNGLEHHQSSEDGTIPRYFLDWDRAFAGRDLLAHEFTHSWNGKFRRPADLWTPNFNKPMRDSLLWVYEGQTQYWGYVLAARSGLLTAQQALDAIALTAATYDARAGREWRDLEDTTMDPIIAMRRPIPWVSWQRSEDYYSEGELVWLDVDTLIRQQSGGKRSLDDFARAFFGVGNGSFVTRTYTFDDIVAALNQVQPHDWAALLRARLTGHYPGAPLDGLARGGYRLTYDDQESSYLRSIERERKMVLLSFSVGATIGPNGVVSGVDWQGPAFKAGLAVGSQIVAVNGDAYSEDDLKDTITAAKTATAPIELLVKDNNQYRTVAVDYHGGLRYPHLTPVGRGPRSLDQILAPRRG